MTPNNTIKDFLDTIERENSGIICPACGSILGIRNQGSTEMILVENARMELDKLINTYRQFIEKLEDYLLKKDATFIPWQDDYPYTRENEFYEFKEKDRGIYTNIFGVEITKKFIEDIDFFQWIDNFSGFHRKQGDGDNYDGKDIKKLIEGLDPKSIIGPLMDLVVDQDGVSKWKSWLKKEGKNILDNFLKEICPVIYGCLDALEKLNSKNHGNKNDPVPDYNSIFRIKLILALILGHHSKNTEEIKIDNLGVLADCPFSLPRKTVVYPDRLKDLLCSEVLLGKCNLGLSVKLLNKMKTKNEKENSSDGKELEEAVRLLGQEICKIVHFSCTNPSNKKVESAIYLSTNSDNKEGGKNSINTEHKSEDKVEKNGTVDTESKSEEMKICGWYPKKEPTHSVILLGSPGTGKSTVMLTGLTTFYFQSSGMGATVSFESPEDEAMMHKFINDYKNGNLPKPTSKGARTTIKLSVEFPEFEDCFIRNNFVFTDIAGEVVAQSLQKEGSDPAVLRILKYAETIIFFFDLSIEPAINIEFYESHQDTWVKLIENYERVKGMRENKKEKCRSNAEVSQIQLLQKLICDLRSQKGVEDLRKEEINFVCVIPKADLFASEILDDKDKRYFMDNFYIELKEKKVLVSKLGRDDKEFSKFSDFRTKGGNGSYQASQPEQNKKEKTKFSFGGGKEEKFEDEFKNLLEYQKSLCNEINRLAIESLQRIGNALGENAEDVVRSGFNNLLKIQLITTLHHNFGKERVYFLPVSAQGKDMPKYENSNGDNQEQAQSDNKDKADKELSSKLSEYVFMLPVVLSAKTSSEEANSATNDNSI